MSALDGYERAWVSLSVRAKGLIVSLSRFANSRFSSQLLTLSLFWVVAAASHSGFIGKWGLRDNEAWVSVKRMLDGTAHRPGVYRHLVPWLANASDKWIVPSRLKEVVIELLPIQEVFRRTTAASLAGYEFRYRVIYLANFAALMASLFLMRRILGKLGARPLPALLAPSIFVLAFPFLETIGGYFYDSVELAFLSAGVLFALAGRGRGLIALTVIATLNKESFFFFLPTLYPFLRQRVSRMQSLVFLTIALLVSGLINIWGKIRFAGNPGVPAMLQLTENLKAYISAPTYFRIELTYGIPGPRGASVASILVFVLIWIRGWRELPAVLKRHLRIALAINIPLFVLLCAPGELRNLSFVSVGFVALMAYAMQREDFVGGAGARPGDARSAPSLAPTSAPGF